MIRQGERRRRLDGRAAMCARSERQMVEIARKEAMSMAL
jgi:hypothetical protein